jgi:hypothetical protein
MVPNLPFFFRQYCLQKHFVPEPCANTLYQAVKEIFRKKLHFFTIVFFRSFSPPLPSAETGMANPRHREKEEEESEMVLRATPTP